MYLAYDHSQINVYHTAGSGNDGFGKAFQQGGLIFIVQIYYISTCHVRGYYILALDRCKMVS